MQNAPQRMNDLATCTELSAKSVQAILASFPATPEQKPVAPSEEMARRLLLVELQSHGLSGNKPFTLRKINTAEPKAFVLQDGDY